MIRYLSGADQFNLLLDRKMIRNGSAGNISRIHLQLDDNVDLGMIRSALLENSILSTIASLQVSWRWPFLPRWTKVERRDDVVNVHAGIGQAEFQAEILNRKVDNARGLAAIDVCALSDGSQHLVISMHHALFDHQGMVNFVKALADPNAIYPIFPDRRPSGWFDQLRGAVLTTIFMLKRASGDLGSLIARDVRPAATPQYRTVVFTNDQTSVIERNAWHSGARIGRSSFYLSAVAKCVYDVLLDREERPPYLWFSMPHDQRKKGAEGHLVTNELTYFFFRTYAEDLQSSTGSVASINQQLKEQLRKRIPERYTLLMNVLRYIPMPLYEAMVDLSAKGKTSSFGYSDIGEDKLVLTKFLGAKVERMFHYQPVLSPPGFTVAVNKERGELQFIWGYFREALGEEELQRMEDRFRKLLLNGWSEKQC